MVKGKSNARGGLKSKRRPSVAEKMKEYRRVLEEKKRCEIGHDNGKEDSPVSSTNALEGEESSMSDLDILASTCTKDIEMVQVHGRKRVQIENSNRNEEEMRMAKKRMGTPCLSLFNTEGRNSDFHTHYGNRDSSGRHGSKNQHNFRDGADKTVTNSRKQRSIDEVDSAGRVEVEGPPRVRDTNEEIQFTKIPTRGNRLTKSKGELVSNDEEDEFTICEEPMKEVREGEAIYDNRLDRRQLELGHSQIERDGVYGNCRADRLEKRNLRARRCSGNCEENGMNVEANSSAGNRRNRRMHDHLQHDAATVFHGRNDLEGHGEEHDAWNGPNVVSGRARGVGFMMQSMKEELSKQLTRELLFTRSTILDRISKLDKNVVYLQKSVDNLYTSVNRGSGKGRKTKDGNTWNQCLDNYVKDADIVFNTTVLSSVLSYYIPKHFQKQMLQNNPEGLLNDLANGLVVLQFSKQGSKDTNMTNVSVDHSEMKYNIVSQAIYNVQRNSFRSFVSDNEQVDDGHKRVHHGNSDNRRMKTSNSKKRETREENNSRIHRPTWLDIDYITATHIIHAKEILEKKRKPEKTRSEPSPYDIAVHGVKSIYKLLVAHLHKARENAKNTFYSELGYILDEWKSGSTHIDQSDMQVSFEVENSSLDVTNDEDLRKIWSELPSSYVASYAQNGAEAEVSNKTLLEQLYTKYPDFIIIAEYPVIVIPNERKSRRAEGQCRQIRRKINLIEVCTRVLVQYAQAPSLDKMLRLHKDSIRTLFMVALVMRKMVVDALRCTNYMDRKFTDLENIRCGGYSEGGPHCTLGSFTPGLVTRQGILQTKCLRLFENEYCALHQREEETEKNSDVGNWGQTNSEVRRDKNAWTRNAQLTEEGVVSLM